MKNEKKLTEKVADDSTTKMSIVERVKILLDFPEEGPVEEKEVEGALKSVQRLVLGYVLEKGDMKLSVSSISLTTTPDAWQKGTESKLFLYDLLNVIAECFDCKVIRSNASGISEFKIIGSTEDKKITDTVFNLVLPLVRRMTRANYRASDRSVSLVKYTIAYQSLFIANLRDRLRDDRKKFLKTEKSDKLTAILIMKNELVQSYIAKKMEVKPSRTKSKDEETGEAKSET